MPAPPAVRAKMDGDESIQPAKIPLKLCKRTVTGMLALIAGIWAMVRT
jgi:hypothetical protein